MIATYTKPAMCPGGRARRLGLALALAASCAGCRAAPPSLDVPAAGESGGVVWARRGSLVTVDDGVIALGFDGATGALVSLVDDARGAELLPGDHGSVAAVVDATTVDPFVADDTRWGSPVDFRGMTLRPRGDGVSLDLEYLAPPGVRIVQHVVLRGGSRVSEWTTDVTVASGSGAMLVGVRSPRVTGVAVPGETLAWPWHEGVRIPDPGDAPRVLEYPVPASMQWAALYGADDGVYLGVRDATGAPKDLRFGRDPRVGGARELSVTFWPYVAAGQAYTSPVVEVGVSDASQWHWGADRYHDWLLAAGLYKATQAPWAAHLAGWQKTYNQFLPAAPGHPPPPPIPYCDDATKLLPNGGTSLHNVLMYGWSFGGLDAYYPDYDFLNRGDVACGDRDDLGRAVAAIIAQDASAHVAFYLNARGAASSSRWYPLNGASAAAKGRSGAPYPCDCYDAFSDAGGCLPPSDDGDSCPPNDPATGRRWLRETCPSALAMNDQLSARAADLRGLGATGIYWDQLAELPSPHCFDRTHGHPTPRSAGVFGNTRFLERMHAEFGAALGPRGYLFAAEGVSDYYAKFLDVASPPPPRLLGYSPEKHCRAGVCDPCAPSGSLDSDVGLLFPCGGIHAPELARMTLPLRVLGLPHDVVGASLMKADSEPDAYAWAFVLGEAMRGLEIHPDAPKSWGPNAGALAYAAVEDANPEIYEDGRFRDTVGLIVAPGPDAVLASAIVGAAGDRVAVQLWNRMTAPVDATVDVDFAALGLGARPASRATALLPGGDVELVARPTGGSLTVHLGAGAVQAVRLTP